MECVRRRKGEILPGVKTTLSGNETISISVSSDNKIFVGSDNAIWNCDAKCSPNKDDLQNAEEVQIAFDSQNNLAVFVLGSVDGVSYATTTLLFQIFEIDRDAINTYKSFSMSGIPEMEKFEVAENDGKFSSRFSLKGK